MGHGGDESWRNAGRGGGFLPYESILASGREALVMDTNREGEGA